MCKNPSSVALPIAHFYGTCAPFCGSKRGGRMMKFRVASWKFPHEISVLSVSIYIKCQILSSCHIIIIYNNQPWKQTPLKFIPVSLPFTPENWKTSLSGNWGPVTFTDWPHRLGLQVCWPAHGHATLTSAVTPWASGVMLMGSHDSVHLHLAGRIEELLVQGRGIKRHVRKCYILWKKKQHVTLIFRRIWRPNTKTQCEMV